MFCLLQKFLQFFPIDSFEPFLNHLIVFVCYSHSNILLLFSLAPNVNSHNVFIAFLSFNYGRTTLPCLCRDLVLDELIKVIRDYWLSDSTPHGIKFIRALVLRVAAHLYFAEIGGAVDP